MSSTDTTAPKTPLRRVILASLVGTTVEWYDFFLYGAAAALVFNKLFFPQADPLTGVMLSFGTYALGFLARPLGGVIFGHFGDRIGRKKLLTVSLVMMGTATFLIGLLPTYGQVGMLAPMMLVALRLVQGFAVGGEWGGAVLLAAEYGSAKRRGFWASWPQAGVPLGNLLAAAVLALMSALLSDADFMAWGWRIPFLLSAVLVVLGFWVRTMVAETPAFEALTQQQDKTRAEAAPALEVVALHKGAVGVGMGLRLGENIAYYIITAFSITYITDVAGLPRSLALNALLVAAAVEFATIPLFGLLSDKIGRRPVYGIAALGLAIWAFGFFQLLSVGTTPAVIAALVIGLVLHGAMYGPQAAMIAELFPTRVRYSGASIAYQVTSIFAGSLAPIIAVALFQRTGSATPIAIYMCAACLVSAVAAFLAKETKGITFAEIDARHATRS